MLGGIVRFGLRGAQPRGNRPGGPPYPPAGMESPPSNLPAVSRADGALEQGLRVIRRRKLLFFQALILIPLIALALSYSQEKEYTAEAKLLFRASVIDDLANPDAGDAFIDPTREAATNDELVTLPVVADRAVARLEREGITGVDVFNSVSVDSGGEADIATISATAATPELAAQVADAYGAAYIDFRQGAEQTAIQDGIDLIEARLALLSPEALEGEEGLRLLNTLERLETAEALQAGDAELVQEAGIPTSPSSPKTLRNVALGILLGAALGLALAALFERFDRRIRTEDELEALFGRPILARIPRSKALSGGWLRGGTQAMTTPELEAFRTLRVNLNYFNVDEGGSRSVLITSPESGDGKSTVARHLAMTMAEMGDDVVLVEADLHKGPPMTAKGGVPGLSSVLAGMPLEQALLEIESSDGGRTVTLLPSGAVPPNPSELLESERMRGVIAELSAHFDWVLVDSPAMGIVSDALALVPAVTGIIVVSGLGTATRDGTNNFVKQLSIVGAEPAGVVANFAKVERVGNNSYYQRETVAQV